MRWKAPACLLGLALLFGAPNRAHTQNREPALSESEVETLREAAYVPANRIMVFIKILDTRSKRISDLVGKSRHAGREQQLHELFEQFSDIAEELNNNLDEYGPKHRDLRKSLPKLLEATERWSTVLRSTGEDSSYKVARKLALDSVADLHKAADELQTDQVAYFKEHPEAVKAERDRDEGAPPERKPQVDIPR